MTIYESVERFSRLRRVGFGVAILQGLRVGAEYWRRLAVAEAQKTKGRRGGEREGGERLYETIKVVAPREASAGVYMTGLQAGSARVRYAAIQEFGGTIQHPGSVGKLQVFEVGGKTIFTMRTRPHPITIPPKAYMTGTKARAFPVVKLEVLRAVTEAARREGFA